MAAALGWLPPASPFAASSTRVPNHALPKAHLFSFAVVAGSSSAAGGRQLAAISPPPGPLRPAASSAVAVPTRRWPPRAAAAESLQAVDEADPEPVEAQIASAVASETPKGEEVFAVVMIGSRQYIVFPGRYIYTQRLKGANVDDKVCNSPYGTTTRAHVEALEKVYTLLALSMGDLTSHPTTAKWKNPQIILNKVLLVGTKKNVYIGEPIVPNAVVHAVVEEQGLDPKVIIFKYKKKKHYRRTIGHRQPNTRIRITGITGYQDAPAEPVPQ